MKKAKYIILGIVLVVVILMGTMFVSAGKELDQLEFGEVDMSQVADGSYEGISETTLVKVTVNVEVADGKIQKIDLIRHENGKGKPAEKIIDTMVQDNTYEVDTVSGATGSSKVIKAAVYDALKKGIKE